MTKTMESNDAYLPHVSVEEVSRFSDTVEIRDAKAFAAELETFVQERVRAVEVSRPVEVDTVQQTLTRKAEALRSDAAWVPSETDIQRGRAALLKEFNELHNLPLPDFARLANKSRQQIYKDIEAGRLLALSVGPRGQKLPDWQLDPVKHQLTQRVLEGTEGIDSWTIYRALSEPLEGLAERSPVEAVSVKSVDTVTKAVFNVLGVH